MAGLIVAGALAAQPKVSAFLDRRKAKRRQADFEKEQGSSKGPAVKSDLSSDIADCLVLLRMVRDLREQCKFGSLTVSHQSEPAGPGEEVLPAYTERETSRVKAGYPVTAERDFNLVWLATAAAALARLEVYCQRDQTMSDAASSSGFVANSCRKKQISTLPPPDVCLAWASVMAGPGLGQISAQQSSLLDLKAFPLRAIAEGYREVPIGVDGLTITATGRNEKGARQRQGQWTEDTGLAFDSTNMLLEQPLTQGISVACPSPACRFGALVPYYNPATSLQEPGKASERGLVQRGWRRRCQDCAQSVSMDTLVGRRLLEDIQDWCQAVDSYGASALELGAGCEGDDAQTTAALTSQLLTPLFRPALSLERSRRNDVLVQSGSLGSEAPRSTNSLGSAMRQAACETFAVEPLQLGESLGWSFTAAHEWIVKHTLLVNPMPALAGAKGAGMPNEHGMPDRMGGGFSAGGLNFQSDNPYEEEASKPATVQVQEKRKRLLAFIDQILGPYRLLKDDGQPSTQQRRRRADQSGSLGDGPWTDVKPGVRRQWRDLLLMEKELTQSHQEATAGITKDGVDGSKVASGAVEAYFLCTSELRSSRRRVPPSFRREALALREVESLFLSRSTPVEVRLARLAHELAGGDRPPKRSHERSPQDESLQPIRSSTTDSVQQVIPSNVGDAHIPDYVQFMSSRLGCVPRGLLGRSPPR